VTSPADERRGDDQWPAMADSVKRYFRRQSKRGSTTDSVTDALREAILDGVIPPSTWLREEELAIALEVSRTPIRESLRRLSDEHLLSRTAHRGSIVEPMTIDDVLSVYHVRGALESLAVFTVTSRPPSGLIGRLVEIQQAATACAESGDSVEGNRLNLEFHRTIRNATGNPILARFLDQVENMVRRSGVSTFADPDRVQKNLQEHEAIIQAIVSGDPDLAQDAAMEHIKAVREARVRALMAPSPSRRRTPGIT
jgi:DNA-binding GntR family transcriptional regulator